MRLFFTSLSQAAIITSFIGFAIGLLGLLKDAFKMQESNKQVREITK